MLNENEFEREVRSYWEEEEEFEARQLSSRKGSKRVYAQNSPVHLLKNFVEHLHLMDHRSDRRHSTS